MELRIGVVETPKELMVELEDQTDRKKLIDEIEAALGNGDRMLWFTDKRGRTVGVPSARIAYIDLSADDQRRVGFGPT